MSAVHDVLRYLLDRVPHSTQEDKDRIAAVIDEDEHGPAVTDESNEETKS